MYSVSIENEARFAEICKKHNIPAPATMSEGHNIFFQSAICSTGLEGLVRALKEFNNLHLMLMCTRMFEREMSLRNISLFAQSVLEQESSINARYFLEFNKITFEMRIRLFEVLLTSARDAYNYLSKHHKELTTKQVLSILKVVWESDDYILRRSCFRFLNI